MVIVDLFAIFEQPADATVRTAHDLGCEPLPEEPILHLQADRAAERVETEDRIVGKYVGAVDSLRGDEIPIDGVAKSLVEADTVLIHGKPLRRSLDRRGDEAAIAQILREIIAVDIDRYGTRNLLLLCVRPDDPDPVLFLRHVRINNQLITFPLETLAWRLLCKIARDEGIPVDELCSEIAGVTAPGFSFAAAARCYIAGHYLAYRRNLASMRRAHGRDASSPRRPIRPPIATRSLRQFLRSRGICNMSGIRSKMSS